MLTRWALSQVTTDPAIRAALVNHRVYEILRPGQQPLSRIDAVPVVTFSAVAALEAAVTHHQLPPGTRAVLYDPEAWSFTPMAEQRDPAGAAARAAAVAHSHDLQLIVSPALNLTTILAPASKAQRWQSFLALRLAAAIARVADVVELQAQSLERDSATYGEFVRGAAEQARSANPRVSVLAGLSTNPPGSSVSSLQITAAIQASRALVDGYWLNVPGRGPRCPTCNPPNPGIAADVLQQRL